MKKEQLIKNLKELRDTLYVTYSNAIDSINSKKENITTSINIMEKNTQEVMGLKELLNKINQRDTIPNFILDGVISSEIKQKNGVNYLEIIYADGKAKATCEKLDTKSILPAYKYHITRKFKGDNALVSYRYDTQYNRADYRMCLRDENGISATKGQIKTQNRCVSYVDAESKVYTYDALEKLKPLYNFENEHIAVVANVVENFRPQYIPSYEESYVSEVFGDRAYSKYNGESNSDLLKDYESGLAMKVGFESYITGDMRPANALIKRR